MKLPTFTWFNPQAKTRTPWPPGTVVPEKPRLRKLPWGQWSACVRCELGLGTFWIPVCRGDSPQLSWANYILEQPGRSIADEQLAHYLRGFAPVGRRHASLVQPEDLGALKELP